MQEDSPFRRRNSGDTTILIVEDHPLYRNALSDLLRQCAGVESVIVAVGSAEEGLAMCERHRGIRLIVLDVDLPGISGLDALGEFKRLLPETVIIVLTGSAWGRSISVAARAGADAYVSKTTSVDSLADLLRRVLRRRPDRFEVLADAVLVPATPAASMPRLTERQRQVLALLGRGHSNKEIGQSLGLAEITIKIYVSSILRAFGVRNRLEAAVAARRLGLNEPEI